jgi:hypothetical protein
MSKRITILPEGMESDDRLYSLFNRGVYTVGKDVEIIEGSLYDEVHIFSNIRSYNDTCPDPERKCCECEYNNHPALKP